MTTALDTSVVVAYWGPDPSLNLAVQVAWNQPSGGEM